MSSWEEFLNGPLGEAGLPGEVMICFVNRYIEGLDGIRYKIKCGGIEKRGVTTEADYCVTVSPKSLSPIQTFVWSKTAQAFKKLDDVIPEAGKRKLVRKIMKTVKTEGKPKPMPRTADKRPPARPAPGVVGQSPIGSQGQIPKDATNENGQAQAAPLRPVPEKITVEQLRKIFPMNKGRQPSDAHLQAVADELNSDLVKFKLDTPIRRAHFFGQIKQESPLLDGAAESLNYSPEGLKATFGYYLKHPDEAQADGRLEEKGKDGSKKVIRKANEEAIANKAYMGPHGNADLGNIQHGDGWRFRGRGVHQTTGRSNYRDFAKVHPKYWGDMIDFVQNPQLLEEIPYNLRSAVAFWLDKECWKRADEGINDVAIDAVTRIINAGEIRKHAAGKYQPHQNPVLKRRQYVHLAYAALT